ncbi:flavin monoamine oxidase family protein [Rhodopirellula sp. MGV]|uniref:flavin monoamine oxidase family protein n=1 Tax=Rhodopirellula sp. MGV TaxID=2023130 RepID=UPI000B9670D6|nr:FAD-dependent oxidoreductase [Rhodopirellula sp. MGV]OYP37255.1 hypothetical protein CGZ80_05625 [Rhodopirellula sp. MGV]PNY33825.1 FAD-dependent oxidoreductase [Rhodopirellula baltica]
MPESERHFYSRRELLAWLAGVPIAGLVGCGWSPRQIDGRLLNPDFSVIHRLRDGWRPPEPTRNPSRHRVVIVGGGIAGLSAAWQLKRHGIDDFVILELDKTIGGTARSGRFGDFRFPWAAHYVPVPMPENDRLIDLFREMGVVVGSAEEGEPIVSETALCRDPHERVFVDNPADGNGRWIYGLLPDPIPSAETRQQLARFQTQMRDFAFGKDRQGRRLFAIPMSQGSDDEQVRALDRISMAEWMNSQGYNAPALRWLVDYGCRDDYGLTAEQTSAWAGVFYFASRWRQGETETQAVITWPEGNGHIVDHLAKSLQAQIKCEQVVTKIELTSRQELLTTAFGASTEQTQQFLADDVIFAAPQFLARRLIAPFEQSQRDVSSFRYGGWVVANVLLSDRPRESNVAMCWDNVISGGASLGYVTSTHQSGIDHGPTVITWYRPLTDDDPRVSRQELMRLTWDDWAQVVTSDLLRAHPDIAALIERIDVMRWGHAMIQPRTGFIWGGARQQAAQSLGRIHFAASDLSGVALMEEAFDRGTRAADQVIRRDRSPKV